MENKGPIYGTELIKSLPIGGGMYQAMPSRNDLQQVAEFNQRTAAGYEVLLNHYQIQAQRILDLEKQLAKAQAAVAVVERLKKVVHSSEWNFCEVWFHRGHQDHEKWEIETRNKSYFGANLDEALEAAVLGDGMEGDNDG